MNDALDLWLLDSGTADQLVACVRTEDDVAVKVVQLDSAFDALLAFGKRIGLALRGLEQRPTEKELTAFGERLYRFLVPEELRPLFDGLDRNAYVRLHLFTNSARIQAVPWEYIQVPQQVPGPSINRPVIRIVPMVGFRPDAVLKRSVKRKLNALFISADPPDQNDAISWRADERKMRDAIESLFDVETIENATTDAITKAFARREFHLVHFAGHGTVKDGVGHVVLCHPRTGNGQLIKATHFANLLTSDKSKVRLVVLAACESSAGDFEDDFSSVAATLVRANIPAVVANQSALPDQTAADFAEVFYSALIRTGDVDRAVGQARNRLATGLAYPGGGGLEWGVPTIHRHMRCARILRV